MAVEITGDPQAEFERARSDYLAVSRGASMYASPDDHRRAEERAWERLTRARERLEELQAVPAGSDAGGR